MAASTAKFAAETGGIVRCLWRKDLADVVDIIDALLEIPRGSTAFCRDKSTAPGQRTESHRARDHPLNKISLV